MSIRHVTARALLTSLAFAAGQAVAADVHADTPTLERKNASVKATPRVDSAVTYHGAEVFGPFEATSFDGDLRLLPKVPAWKPGDPIKEIPRRDNRVGPVLPEIAPAHAVLLDRDPLLALQENAVARDRAVTPGLNFAGQGFTGVVPPDTVGDVGLDYYIQMVNSGGGSQFTIYNKATGAVVAGPTTVDSLGSGNCANGLGDPIVVYDELADRWLISEFSSAGNRLCVYVSKVSGDPIAGGWWAYQFTATNFPDYPKYGVWPDAYYVSSNESSPAVYALDRSKMLNGLAATFQRFTAPPLSGFGFQALTPVDLDGSAPPPVGTPGYFLRHRDDERHNAGSNDPLRDFVEVWAFDVDFVTPANSSFTGPSNIALAEFDSSLCGFTSFNCFPQPGTGVTLDPIREVVMFRAAYRVVGGHEALVGNFVTDVNFANRGGVRWFELRRSGGPWSLFQEGTHAPADTHNRWLGGIAMDQSGNIALGYSLTSSMEAPDIRYTGRLATDPPGVMSEPETTIFNGSGSSPSNRWGDYSDMAVDPADDCTFWYTNEHVLNSGNWATRIASFTFDSCGGGCGNGLLDAGETCDDANTADGDGCSSSCQVEDGWVCADPIPPSPGGNVVGDPGFEAGTPNPEWTEFSSNFGTPLCTVASCGSGAPFEGLWWAWFGGIAGIVETGSLEQSVTLPVGADTLEFRLQIPGAPGTSGFMRVRVDGNIVFSVTQADAPSYAAYTLVSVDVSAFDDGGTHALRFESTTNAGAGPLNFFVDKVEILDPGNPGTPSVCERVDADGDGVADDADNCINVANATQLDTDGDFIGNICDGDFDQNCSVNFGDLGIMKGNFFLAGNLETDMNGDNSTNFGDLGILKAAFFLPPGPSGIPNFCAP